MSKYTDNSQSNQINPQYFNTNYNCQCNKYIINSFRTIAMSLNIERVLERSFDKLQNQMREKRNTEDFKKQPEIVDVMEYLMRDPRHRTEKKSQKAELQFFISLSTALTLKQAKLKCFARMKINDLHTKNMIKKALLFHRSNPHECIQNIEEVYEKQIGNKKYYELEVVSQMYRFTLRDLFDMKFVLSKDTAKYLVCSLLLAYKKILEFLNKKENDDLDLNYDFSLDCIIFDENEYKMKLGFPILSKAQDLQSLFLLENKENRFMRPQLKQSLYKTIKQIYIKAQAYKTFHGDDLYKWLKCEKEKETVSISSQLQCLNSYLKNYNKFRPNRQDIHFFKTIEQDLERDSTQLLLKFEENKRQKMKMSL